SGPRRGALPGVRRGRSRGLHRPRAVRPRAARPRGEPGDPVPRATGWAHLAHRRPLGGRPLLAPGGGVAREQARLTRRAKFPFRPMTRRGIMGNDAMSPSNPVQDAFELWKTSLEEGTQAWLRALGQPSAPQATAPPPVDFSQFWRPILAQGMDLWQKA